ncbi:MAG: alpha/beta fold hydrolase [Pseudomonadales bacterium]
MARNFKDIRFQSNDGLELYARDYPALEDESLTIFCMAGLTRNSVDFAPLIETFSLAYRVICADLRGRGLSEYDSNPGNYQVAVYVDDMFKLLDELSIQQTVLIGTSLGGIMAMAMQTLRPGHFKAIVMNDIGPELDPIGLNRIKDYVGEDAPVTNWDEAAQRLHSTSDYIFPDYSSEDWLSMAHRLYKENESGVPVLNFDPKISEPMNGEGSETESADLWALFESCRELPVLLVRGELSDLLHPDCVAKMQRIHPTMHFAEVPRVGHVPVLDEEVAVAAISGFLAALSN